MYVRSNPIPRASSPSAVPARPAREVPARGASWAHADGAGLADLSTVERYRDERLRAGAATGTVKMELGVFHMASRWGRETGACPARDLPKVGLRVKPARNQHTPSAGDIAAVVEQLDGWPRLAVILMMGTGARIREVAHMRWEDVDLEAGTVRIRESKTRPRTLPVASDVLCELRSHGPGRPQDGLFGVLSETVMGQLRSRYLPRACEQAGVQRFTAHALRRAAVDRFLRSGVDVGTAAAFFGHSPKVMLTHYRRATEDDLRDALRRSGLGSRLGSNVLDFPTRDTG